MKILLVHPSQRKLYGELTAPSHPPLGLSYIGAVLERAGHQVTVIDSDAEKASSEDCAGIAAKGGFGLVGVTCVTPTFNTAVTITAAVKAWSRAYTVLGGIHPTLMPRESVEPSSVDFVVRGEGEETVVELVAALEEKRDLSGVRGLAYKENGNTILTGERPLLADLSSLPFPARHLFKHQVYRYPDALFHPVLPMMTSRGCPGSCTYCNTKQMYAQRFRVRNPVDVVNEIEFLHRTHKVREVHIWDDNFVTQKERVFKVRDELARRKLQLKFAFPNGIRIDFLDEPMLRALRDMGTYSMALGIESGNQRILDKIKKRITLQKIRERFALIKRMHFETWGFFILGIPGETKETIFDTIRFAVALNPDIAKFHILKPFPGTEVYDELKSDGLITETDYDMYGIHTRPVHRLPGISGDDLLALQKKAYRAFYLRPDKLASQMMRMKTWHRFYLNTQTAFSLIRKMVR
jgi:anaerobic magnesium-protoporphyrin IX monomethyl ester cyclase